MLRKLLPLIVICLLASGVAVADTAMKLDLNAIYGATSFHTIGAMDFAQKVKELSKGSIDITVHPGGSLGFKGPELLKAVKDAQIPMSDILMGVVAGSEQVFGISSLPRLAASFEQAKDLYDDCRPMYEKAAQKWNQKLLYAAPWPPSGLVTSIPINSAADIKGLKTRTYDKNGASFLQELGGSPLSLPWGEVYASLRTGMIDSVLTSAESTKNGKFWEVLSHFTDINYAFPLNMVTINLDYWKSMSKAQQEAMLNAAKEIEAAQWHKAKAATEEALTIIKENGFEIAQPSAELASQMDKAAAKIVEEFTEKADEKTKAVLKKFIK